MLTNKVGIVDYDAGNLRSVVNAVRNAGGDPVISALPEVLSSCDRVILPGVGEASTAMGKLSERGLDTFIPTLTVPVLGICIGLQLMCISSDEGNAQCMGIFPSVVKRITDLPSEPSEETMKIPHMGWNSLSFPNEGRLFKGIGPNPYVYFVHSYYLEAADRSTVTATTDYNVTIDASIECKNLFACQFHPEKSGSVGLAILENFIRL